MPDVIDFNDEARPEYRPSVAIVPLLIGVIIASCRGLALPGVSLSSLRQILGGILVFF